MPRSMADPDYEYRPLSDEMRQRLSLAHRRRLGIPDGYARVYGIDVPLDRADDVARKAYDATRRAGKRAGQATAKALAIRTTENVIPSNGKISSAYARQDVTLPTTVRG